MKAYYTHRIPRKCFCHLCGHLQGGASRKIDTTKYSRGFGTHAQIQNDLLYRKHRHTLAWIVIYYIHTIRYAFESITNIFICIVIFNVYFKQCTIFKT
jgi:hypothetical protein